MKLVNINKNILLSDEELKEIFHEMKSKKFITFVFENDYSHYDVYISGKLRDAEVFFAMDAWRHCHLQDKYKEKYDSE